MENCSLCKETIVGFGNSAQPYDGKCCDKCNSLIVIPARIAMNNPETLKIMEAYIGYNNSKSNEKFNYTQYRLISDETFIQYAFNFDDAENVLENKGQFATDDFYNNPLIKNDLDNLDLYLLKSGHFDMSDVAIGDAWVSELYVNVENDYVCLYVNAIDGEELGTIDFPLSEVRNYVNYVKKI